MKTFVLLLDVEQLARGLQQLVMMLLPHLQSHTGLVVAVLEAVVGRKEAGGAATLRTTSGGPTHAYLQRPLPHALQARWLSRYGRRWARSTFYPTIPRSAGSAQHSDVTRRRPR